MVLRCNVLTVAVSSSLRAQSAITVPRGVHGRGARREREGCLRVEPMYPGLGCESGLEEVAAPPEVVPLLLLWLLPLLPSPSTPHRGPRPPAAPTSHSMTLSSARASCPTPSDFAGPAACARADPSRLGRHKALLRDTAASSVGGGGPARGHTAGVASGGGVGNTRPSVPASDQERQPPPGPMLKECGAVSPVCGTWGGVGTGVRTGAGAAGAPVSQTTSRSWRMRNS
jgi:hypothetical protein